MHSRMFRALGAVGAVGASLALAGPAFAATTPTLYVNTPANHGTDTNPNGTPNTCRIESNPCATIQHAINEAPTTAKISVAAGTYAEQLTITSKNLTITGAGEGSTVIQPNTTLTTTQNDPTHPGTNQADIVTFSGAKSGGLASLTVDGSQDTETDGGTNYVGVFFLNSAGTLDTVAISNVQHDAGTFGDQPGANGGVLVANSDSLAHAVTMTSVDITAYDKNGITCRSTGTTCTIKNSTVTGSGAIDDNAQNGIELYGITAGTVTGTTVEHNTYISNYPTTYSSGSGILAINLGKLSVTGNNTLEYNDDNIAAIEDQTNFATGPKEGAWTITGNTVEDATDAGNVPLGGQVGDGIELTGTKAAVVNGNRVTSNADWGIALFGAVNSKVGSSASPNTVDNNANDGIYLGEYNVGQASTGNVVSYNEASGNGDDGILAAGADSSGNQQAKGNTFGHNTLGPNTVYDAQDQSSGSKTAHTANTWTGNTCTPTGDADPGAICS